MEQNVEKGRSTYLRYKCSCSLGFTKIVKVDGIPACAKCLSRDLKPVECNTKARA